MADVAHIMPAAEVYRLDPTAAIAPLFEPVATERTTTPVNPDADLLSLIAQYGPALAAFEAAFDASDVVRDTYWELEPKRPPALYGKLDDFPLQPTGREPDPSRKVQWTFYTDRDIELMRDRPAMRLVDHLRPADWNTTDMILRREAVPDERGEARRQEILAEWDTWCARKADLKESTGLNAANSVCETLGIDLCRIEDAIFEMVPNTFHGLQAKARWISALPLANKRAKHLMHDLLRMPPVCMQAPAARVA